MVNKAVSQEQLDGMMEIEGLIAWFGDINGKLRNERLSISSDAGEVSE